MKTKRAKTYVVSVESYNDNAETEILNAIVNKLISKEKFRSKHIEIAVNTLANAIREAGLDIISVGRKTITTLNNRISFNTYTDFSAEHC